MWLPNETLNWTTNAAAAYQWHFIPVLRIVMVTLTLSINAIVLAAFFLNDRLIHNPFMIYLINLLLNNMVYGLLANIMNILVSLHGDSYHWMDKSVCGLYLYANYTGVGIVMNCHALVTLNRIWAIVFPVSYRNRHTPRIAVLLCVSVFAYVHIFILSGIVKHSVEDHLICDWQLRMLMSWRHAIQLLVYDAPLLFQLGAYPFLFYKRRQFMQKTQKEEMQRRASKREKETNFLEVPRQMPLRSQSVTCETEERREMFKRSKSLSVTYRKDALIIRRMQSNPDGSYGFLVLTLLTISVLICWAAPHAFWTILQFKELPENIAYLFGAMIPSILYPVQAVADPILFALALPDLRRVLCRYCKKRA
ncbi:uncharacterized protein LOC129595132 [Paramacrobiotus metropolitanus]|uniref:uncharacterized protein LOC129595132 n=1 Tax=Paramacrobiotus metropolitanus TaxID=2943436 RepID=UPI00244592DB|nr:uncharacterized protein LOC129595132 [Paramacrobiotus metropolitanus]